MSQTKKMRDFLTGVLDTVEAFKPADPDIHMHVLWCEGKWVVHTSKGLSKFIEKMREEFNDNLTALRSEIDKRIREVKP